MSAPEDLKAEIIRNLKPMNVERGEDNDGISVWTEKGGNKEEECELIVVNDKVYDVDDWKKGFYGAGILVPKTYRDGTVVPKNNVLLRKPKIPNSEMPQRAFYPKNLKITHTHSQMTARVAENLIYEGKRVIGAKAGYYEFSGYQCTEDISNKHGSQRLKSLEATTCAYTGLEMLPLYPQLRETIGSDLKERKLIPHHKVLYRLCIDDTVAKVKKEKAVDDITEQTERLALNFHHRKIVKDSDDEGDDNGMGF